MENSLPVALSRQDALWRQMDMIATNLANANTAGYKADRMIFSEFVDRTSPKDPPLSLVHDMTFLRDMSEGPIGDTGNPLDLAISGDGFFTVQTAKGPRYTRHGAFQLNNQSQITSLSGNPLLGAGGAPIQVPQGTETITITRDGTVSADGSTIGQIQLVSFASPQALVKEGNDLYDAKKQQPAPPVNAEIHQGSIEGSNVQGVVEMTRMINVVRNYQAANRLVETEHRRILDAIDGIVGKT